MLRLSCISVMTCLTAITMLTGCVFVEPALTTGEKGVYFRSTAGESSIDCRVDTTISLKNATMWSHKLDELIASGYSSPIVVNDKIFISSAAEDACLLSCYALADGELLWQRNLTELNSDTRQLELYVEYGLACSTPAAAGDKVVVFFSDGWAYCLDTDGELVWQQLIAPEPINAFGLASSPIIYRDMAIFQIDLDEDQQTEKYLSFITAVSLADGSVRWRSDREVWPSWTTPVIHTLSDSRDVLVTTAAPWLIVYDPLTGKQLTRCGELIGDVAATPVCSGNMVYAFSDPSGDMLAVDISTPSDDISESAVKWTQETDMPDVSSPVFYDGRIYYCGSMMQLHCVSAETGELLWSAPLETSAYASVTIAAGKICTVDTKGNLVLFDSESGKKTACWKLPDPVNATPAIISTGTAPLEMIIRTEKKLMRLKFFH